jgi:hypothetical protein
MPFPMVAVVKKHVAFRQSEQDFLGVSSIGY